MKEAARTKKDASRQTALANAVAVPFNFVTPVGPCGGLSTSDVVDPLRSSRRGRDRAHHQMRTERAVRPDVERQVKQIVIALLFVVAQQAQAIAFRHGWNGYRRYERPHHLQLVRVDRLEAWMTVSHSHGSDPSSA